MHALALAPATDIKGERVEQVIPDNCHRPSNLPAPQRASGMEERNLAQLPCDIHARKIDGAGREERCEAGEAHRVL